MPSGLHPIFNGSLSRLIRRLVAMIMVVIGLAQAASAQTAQPVLAQFLPKVSPADLVEGADGYGPIREDVPVAPLLRGGEQIGYVFVTSDFVGTTGYSGKPIHTMVAVDADARILGIDLVKHSEPIVLIGIPDSKIKAMMVDYIGVSLVEEAAAGGSAHDLNIISGATVTIMVIDDSVIRSGLKVARALGLGGLHEEADTGPKFAINMEAAQPQSWTQMEGDGTVRRLTLDVGQVNGAFEELGDPRTAKRALTEPPETTFIDMQAALVSVPRDWRGDPWRSGKPQSDRVVGGGRTRGGDLRARALLVQRVGLCAWRDFRPYRADTRRCVGALP